MDAYNQDGGHVEPEDDPLWAAYEATRDAITAARPLTMAGMRAKALAAKAEGRGLDDDSWRGTPGANWAWDLLNDLLRLAPGGAA